MPIGPITSAPPSNTAPAAQNPLQNAANTAPANTNNNVSNTSGANNSSSPDNSATQQVSSNPWEQFAALLAMQNQSLDNSKNSAAANTAGQTPNQKSSKDSDNSNTANSATTTAATTQAAIAVPAMPVYIDQQANQNVVLTQNGNSSAVGDATSGSKKFVFADNSPTNLTPPAVTATPLPATAQAQAQAQTPNAALANEVYTGFKGNQVNAANNNGKIKLASSTTISSQNQDSDFSKAFANIVQQANGKTANAQTATTTAQNQQQTDSNATSDDTTTAAAATTTALNATTDASDQPTAKISPKVLGVKEDKIALSTDTTPDMAAKLQSFDTQLQTKSYAQVSNIASSLPSSATDQVQVKISQALASNENSIKINLHPAELGSVNVNMNTDDQGNTKIHIIAEKTDTLNLLKQDSTHLVKSLSEIGVKADAGSLQFSLRGGNQQNLAQGQTQGGAANDNSNQDNQQQSNAATATYSRFTNLNEQTLTVSQNSGLNILV